MLINPFFPSKEGYRLKMWSQSYCIQSNASVCTELSDKYRFQKTTFLVHITD